MNPVREKIFGMSADSSSSRVSNGMKRLWVALILILAFFGIADSAYLAQHELSGTPLICNVSGLSGCNTVAESPFSNLFGIPLALYGVAFYSGMFILAAVELLLSRSPLRRWLQAGALAGALASVCFTLIQQFLIGAFCIYCIISAALTVLMLICAGFLEPFLPRKSVFITPPPKLPPLLMPPAP